LLNVEEIVDIFVLCRTKKNNERTKKKIIILSPIVFYLFFVLSLLIVDVYSCNERGAAYSKCARMGVCGVGVVLSTLFFFSSYTAQVVSHSMERSSTAWFSFLVLFSLFYFFYIYSSPTAILFFSSSSLVFLSLLDVIDEKIWRHCRRCFLAKLIANNNE
jgi:hypothetical protein